MARHSKVWFSAVVIASMVTTAASAHAVTPLRSTPAPRPIDTKASMTAMASAAKRPTRTAVASTHTETAKPTTPSSTALSYSSKSGTKTSGDHKPELTLSAGLSSGVRVAWLTPGQSGLTHGKIVAAKRLDATEHLVYEVVDDHGHKSEVGTRNVRVTDELPKTGNPFAAGAQFIEKTSYAAAQTAAGRKPDASFGAQVSWLEDPMGSRTRRFGVVLRAARMSTRSTTWTIVDEHGHQQDIETSLTYEGNYLDKPALQGRPEHASAPTAKAIYGSWVSWTDSRGERREGRVRSSYNTYYDSRTKQYEHHYGISREGREYLSAKGPDLKVE